jgi:hypothetical protein
MISIQTLQDVLVALATTVGVAAAISLAFMAAGALFDRDQARVAKAQRPTHTYEVREPVAR